jgi:hypothetical protein
MGDLANIFDFQSVRRPKLASAAFAAPHVDYSDVARLIPGVSDSASSASISQPQLKNLAMHFVPRLCHKFQAGMLAPAMLDVALMTLVISLEAWIVGSRPLHSVTLCIYLLSFLVFAIQEDLYVMHKASLPENAAACRAIAWATLFAGLFLGWSPVGGSGIILCALSLCTLGALVTARLLRRTLCHADAPLRNVLIVGNGMKAAEIAEAICRDQNSSRLIKGYITETHLCNSYGPAMLSRVAREEFVDELIIASSDSSAIDVAVQEAYKNKLDVKIAPDICVPILADVENIGGLPLFKIQSHQRPEYRLALKRILDFVLAIVGLIAFSPLLLVIAACIRLESAGPILYRAPRTGRRGERFVCYKFRTMVPDADALKDDLRGQNERQGAFSKSKTTHGSRG